MSGRYYLYKFLSSIIHPFVIKKYNLNGERIVIPQGGNLILSNHVTNVDFLLINAMTNGTYMNFVLAENAFRNKILNGIINMVNEPIIHVKGSNSLNTIKDISRQIKQGNNVMLFPEGNTSFDGSTACLDENIGKLVKVCLANLVLIKIKGGYLSRPRWGTSFRKGKISMESLMLPLDEIKKMSVSEITDIINSSIYTDAYEEQKEAQIEFKGKRSCLGIERAMYQCPGCKEIGTLKSEDKTVNCDCGYTGEYNSHGYIKDSVAKSNDLHPVKEYLDNQKLFIKNKIIECSNRPDETILFSDEVSVKEITDKNKTCTPMQIVITAYCDRAVCRFDNGTEERTILYKNIKNVTLFKANTMTVFVDDMNGEKNSMRVFEINGNFSFNALKYRDVYEIINEV